MHRRRLRTLSLLATSLACTASLFVLAHAQEAPAPDAAGRVLVQPTGLPGMDCGLREEWPSPGARGRSAAHRAQVNGRGGDYEPGKVIVKFRGGVSSARATSLARSVGASEITHPSDADFDLLKIDPTADAEAVASSLATREDVEYAQAAYRVYPSFHPNDPLYDRQWNLPLIGLEQAWDINPGSTNSVVVAVLDTGVAFENATFSYFAFSWVDDGLFYPSLGRISVPFAAAPELGGSDRFVAPRDFIWNDTHPVDTDGHGTHVTGTIGQLTNNGVGVAGVAFNVKIMPVKCISGTWDDIFDSPFVGTDDVVARAIRYAADNGAKVVNMSLGRSGGTPAAAVGDAMKYAVGKGVFIAVAGGNDYEDGNPIERLAEQAGPIDGAVVVAAVGPDSNRSYYSGVQSYIEIAAPGGNGRLPNGGVLQQTYDPTFSETFDLPPSSYTAPRFDAFVYRFFQGTSMATPHVSGLAALLYSQGITSPAAIEAAMKKFARDRGAAGRDNEYGYGIIDTRATLRGLGLLK